MDILIGIKMKDKEKRLNILSEIINDNKIETQDELLKLMKEKGFNITQGTLSRDLRILKVSKISDGWNSYYYTISSSFNSDDFNINQYISDIKNGIVSMEFNGSIGVIKTRSGYAQSVCVALDTLKFPEILGTIAGDDTIFIVLREGSTKETLLDEFHQNFPKTK